MIKIKDLKNIIPDWQECKFEFVDSTIINTKKALKTKHNNYEVISIYSSPITPRLIIEINGTY